MEHVPQSDKGRDENTQASIFLRIRVVMRLTSLGRSTIYRLMAENQFPAPVRLTRRVIAWRRDDLERWTNERTTVTH